MLAIQRGDLLYVVPGAAQVGVSSHAVLFLFFDTSLSLGNVVR